MWGWIIVIILCAAMAGWLLDQLSDGFDFDIDAKRSIDKETPDEHES